MEPRCEPVPHLPLCVRHLTSLSTLFGLRAQAPSYCCGQWEAGEEVGGGKERGVGISARPLLPNVRCPQLCPSLPAEVQVQLGCLGDMLCLPVFFHVLLWNPCRSGARSLRLLVARPGRVGWAWGLTLEKRCESKKGASCAWGVGQGQIEGAEALGWGEQGASTFLAQVRRNVAASVVKRGRGKRWGWGHGVQTM